MQQWWYNSKVYARTAALLAVRTVHTKVVIVAWFGVQEEMMSLLAAWFFSRAHIFLQGSFLVQHGAADIIALEGATNTCDNTLSPA